MAPKVALASDTARHCTKRRAGTNRGPHGLCPILANPGPGRYAGRAQGRSAIAKRWTQSCLDGDRLDHGQGRQDASAAFDLGPQSDRRPTLDLGSAFRPAPGRPGLNRRPLDPQSRPGHRWTSPDRAHWALDQPKQWPGVADCRLKPDHVGSPNGSPWSDAGRESRGSVALRASSPVACRSSPCPRSASPCRSPRGRRCGPRCPPSSARTGSPPNCPPPGSRCSTGGPTPPASSGCRYPPRPKKNENHDVIRECCDRAGWAGTGTARSLGWHLTVR